MRSLGENGVTAKCDYFSLDIDGRISGVLNFFSDWESRVASRGGKTMDCSAAIRYGTNLGI